VVQSIAWKQQQRKEKGKHMKTNNQNAVLTVEDLQAAADALRTLRNRIPFPPALTPAERQQLRAQRIGPRTLHLLQERVAAARQNRELLPPAFDLRKFTRDAAVVAALSDCLDTVKSLEVALRDTLLAVGSQAKDEGDLVYGHILVSTGAGGRLKRSLEKIARRGTRTPRQSRPEAPAPATEPKASAAGSSTATGPAATPTPAPVTSVPAEQPKAA
jgi:hypothetical protein